MGNASGWQTVPAGRFAGPVVMSMRPIPAHLVAEASRITARYPQSHGAPLHVGDALALGTPDLFQPDFGDAVSVQAGEVPVFWGCGVPPQLALLEAGAVLAITHAPGHMFMADEPQRAATPEHPAT